MAHWKSTGRRLAITGAALLLFTTITTASSSALAHTSEARVDAWMTTPDQSRLLAPVGSTRFDDNDRSGHVIEVDPHQTYQTMDGFGASITDSSASLLHRLPRTQRDAVMKSLFSPTEGIGMSFMRQPIGASDFVDGDHYTYNDNPPGGVDLGQEHFSIEHDEARILPLLRQALQLNPDLKVIGAPWSVPAWMKDNGSLVGGRVIDKPQYFESYARYLVRFVQDYADAGVPIYGISIQNEPQNRFPDAYPGTDLPTGHQDRIIGHLGPMLQAAGLGDVKIISYDHNWALHPDDGPQTPKYPFDALNSPNAEWIDGTGYHSYFGDASAQSALRDAFPDKDIWFTEGSGFRGNGDDFAKYFADTLNWHAENIQIAATRNWAKGAINWNLALDSRGGPVNGGCGNSSHGVCTGVLTIDGDTVTRNAEYYTIGHMSKFIEPGAVRVGSDNGGDLHNVAFENPDGSYTLVVKNVGGSRQEFSIGFNGRTAPYTLPGKALATFTWSATDTTP